MKTDIKREGMWWSWVEHCDRCGRLSLTHHTKTTAAPDREKVDFCYFCLMDFLDNNISIKEVRENMEKLRNKNRAKQIEKE